MADLVTSNGSQIVAHLAGVIAGLAVDDELARDLAEIVGGGMHDRATAMKNPDGSRYEPNAPATIQKKGFDWPGIDTGEMLKRTNFTEGGKVTGDGFELSYTGPADKLGWFEGDNRYGIARLVWGTDPAIEAAIHDRLARHVDAKVGGASR